MMNKCAKPTMTQADIDALTVVVTRHPALVQFLRNRGMITEGNRIIEHATQSDIYGKTIIGNVSLGLAAMAREVITVDLGLTREQRGRELSLADIEGASPVIRRYRVTCTGALCSNCEIWGCDGECHE